MTDEEKKQLVEAVITQLKNDGTDVSSATVVEDVSGVLYILCNDNKGNIVRVSPYTINQQANADLTETNKNIANQLLATPAADKVTITGRNEQSMRINFEVDIPAATTEKAGVMSAEDKVVTNSLICNEFTGDSLINLGFYNVVNKNIGDVMPTYLNGSSTKYYAIFEILAGTKVNLKTYLTSTAQGAVRPYVVCNKDGIITQMPDKLYTYDYTQGINLDINEDSILYVACNVENQSDFQLSAIGKIIERIILLEKTADDIIDRTDIVEKRLGEVVDKKQVYTKDEATASNAYYNLQGVEIGSSYSGATRSTAGRTYYTLKVDVKAGYEITIKTYTTSNVAGYVRGYCLTNPDDIVVDIAEAKTTLDFLTGKNLSVESDGTLYVTCTDGYQDLFSVKVITQKSEVSINISNIEKTITGYKDSVSYTKMFGLYLPNNKVVLNGASFSQYNGYFELAMKKLSINGTNESVAGTNIFKLANKLYSNPVFYKDFDVLIIAHVHNFDVFNLPTILENYTPSQYENDSIIGEYITTQAHISGAGGFENTTYTDDELYAIGYDYCIKKYIELCYNLKDQEGYDPLIGKPAQILLYTHWHDARVTYNESIRRLANKWGLYLVKEDENIGFSKKRIHPVANKQQSILYCNGTPWGSKTEVIDGVTYGFHPSGIASGEWTNFIQSNEAEMIKILPYIQIKRASILIDVFSNKI